MEMGFQHNQATDIAYVGIPYPEGEPQKAICWKYLVLLGFIPEARGGTRQEHGA